MWGGSFIVTVNTKLLGGNISFFQCVCVLGYCIFPIVLAAAGIYFLKIITINVLFIKMIIAGFALVWATLSIYKIIVRFYFIHERDYLRIEKDNSSLSNFFILLVY